MTRRRAVLALVPLALVSGWAGACSTPDRAGAGPGVPGSPTPRSRPGSGGPASGGPASGDGAADGAGPNTTDIAWLQLLIAMNERLLPIFDLVPSRSGDPAVQLYASVARRAREAELESLRKLAAGVTMPSDNPHLQHDMPGMPTAAQRDEMTRSSGKAFDRGFAAAMIAHLDQTSRLCTGEQNAGADPAFRSLAESIARGVGEERARASALDARAASPSANTR
ncbi:DUF305 domain-containing protein [Asanoa iriomotensis]|uniref:DUF305 domain-containing protein n=1 Tax=Asanoa iriomotensis TaxID=234613 RepID=A0ABQ4C4F7_9ACTN|nr:DUF305 domain-containing protein [Asanoa iriomotensis]GIF57673.1 hypothetical protein Air01nite_37680 [Asanoa iriomotensis]